MKNYVESKEKGIEKEMLTPSSSNDRTLPMLAVMISFSSTGLTIVMDLHSKYVQLDARISKNASQTYSSITTSLHA